MLSPPIHNNVFPLFVHKMALLLDFAYKHQYQLITQLSTMIDLN